jgi:hypothetical protein
VPGDALPGGAPPGDAMPGDAMPRQGRDPAIDAVRGWCVVSMATAHLAMGSTWWSVMHAPGWVDGAVGFVVLSGVVVGITQRRTAVAQGLAAAHQRTVKRIGLLYGLHIALCAVALAVTAIEPSHAGRLPSAAAEDGWAAAIVSTLTLRVNPPEVSILALYAVMSLMTPLVVLFLASRVAIIALIVSVLIYAYGWAFPEMTTFPERAGKAGYVNWATWQALFVAALIIGWHWRSPALQKLLRAGWSLAVATAAAVGLGIAGYLDTRQGVFQDTPWAEPVADSFGDGRLGPGTIMFAFLASFVLYRVARAAYRADAGRVLCAPLALLGRHSLDGYVLIGLVAMVFPAIHIYRPDRAAGMLLALVVLAAVLAWARLRESAKPRGVSRRAPTAPTQLSHSASPPSSAIIDG